MPIFFRNSSREFGKFRDLFSLMITFQKILINKQHYEAFSFK